MSNLNVLIADKITKKCIEAYNKLSKTGKPIEKEWTVLSCVLQNDKFSENLEVVSLGTGSKCVGAIKMSPKGDVLNDSHAEVVARRGFLVYLYDNIERTLSGGTTIFTCEKDRFKLKPDIEFYFYSSQLPCGDASIMPKSVEETLVGDIIESRKRQADNVCDIDVKKQRVGSGDIHRTGAKCLPDCEQDKKESDENYHLLGQVRTKPGRGDRTLSVSCSDKISRWIHLGIHGGLMDMLLTEPIFMKLYIFGGGVPYSNESIERALLRRKSGTSGVDLEYIPEFQQSTIVFPQIKTEDNIRPAPGSIIWIKTQNLCAEVAIQGRKLGVTKKKAALLSSSLFISKYNIYKRFLKILLSMDKVLLKNIISEESIEGIPYNEMKKKSKRYIEKWEMVKNQVFGTWTVKPDIWNFLVDLT